MTDDNLPGEPGESKPSASVIEFNTGKRKGKAKQPADDATEPGPDGFLRGDKGINPRSPNNIKLAISKLGITLFYNEFSTQTEIKGLPNFGLELTDAGVICLRFLIDERFHFLPEKQMTDDVITDLAYLNRYHPVRDYLKGLSWDKTPRIDKWLVTYGGAEDNEFNRAIGRLFLIAAVRRVRKPGCKFDTVIVLESPEGKNKSSAVRELAIKEEWFTDNLPVGASSKEVIEQSGGIWIAEYPELEGLSKKEAQRIKAFLSRQTDRARAAFGRRSQSVNRQFVAIGSVNDDKYLSAEENRRWWPVKIEKFKLDDLKRDVDQLWAEAAHYEALDEEITLKEELWSVAKEVQDERKVENPFVDTLRERLGDGDGWILSTTVWMLLDVPIERRKGSCGLLGAAMKELGFVRGRVKAQGDVRGPRDTSYFQRGEQNIKVEIANKPQAEPREGEIIPEKPTKTPPREGEIVPEEPPF